jgi:hypothetical protein
LRRSSHFPPKPNTIGTVRVSCLTAVAPWVPETRMISGVSASNSAAYETKL